MRQKKQAKMFSLVQQWQAGEQTKKAFCKNHQLNPTTFHYWIQKYNLWVEQDSTKVQNTSFIPLSVNKPLPVTIGATESGPTVLELSYPNGVHLQFKEPISITYLSSLIKLPL